MLLSTYVHDQLEHQGTKPDHSMRRKTSRVELTDYFNGKLAEFKTPIALLGSPFQQRVWQELLKIPCGETCSYLQIAKNLGKPTAFRAVTQANGANQLALIIPCHRVINSNGELGGYGGGITRKKWLLNHEKDLQGTATQRPVSAL